MLGSNGSVFLLKRKFDLYLVLGSNGNANWALLKGPVSNQRHLLRIKNTIGRGSATVTSDVPG